MTHSMYSNMTTEELVRLVFNSSKVDDLTMELATRLIMAEEELGYPLNDEPEAA